jgi:hypothetical protein
MDINLVCTMDKDHASGHDIVSFDNCLWVNMQPFISTWKNFLLQILLNYMVTLDMLFPKFPNNLLYLNIVIHNHGKKKCSLNANKLVQTQKLSLGLGRKKKLPFYKV